MKKRIAYAVSLALVAFLGVVAHATTVSGGTPTVQRSQAVVNQDGSEQITLIYLNASGAIVTTRTLFIDSGCTKVIDNMGNTVSSTGPTAVCNAAAAYASQLDTTIANAAAGGKLSL